MGTQTMRGLVVVTAVTAALAVPATAALADSGHGRGHHAGTAEGHDRHGRWLDFRCLRAEEAATAATPPAPSPRPARPAGAVPRPVAVVTVVRRSVVVAAPPPSSGPPPSGPALPSSAPRAAAHLFVGTPTAAQPATSGARVLAGVAAAAVVVTLIEVGFSVRRGLARVD